MERAKIPEQLSLLELRGLGKECWAGVDPVAYIREERDSWSPEDEPHGKPDSALEPPSGPGRASAAGSR